MYKTTFSHLFLQKKVDFTVPHLLLKKVDDQMNIFSCFLPDISPGFRKAVYS